MIKCIYQYQRLYTEFYKSGQIEHNNFMYTKGTSFRVVKKINLGEEQFESGLTGEITGSENKMVGKAYVVKFEDGRVAKLHMVILNNQTEVIKTRD